MVAVRQVYRRVACLSHSIISNHGILMYAGEKAVPSAIVATANLSPKQHTCKYS